MRAVASEFRRGKLTDGRAGGKRSHIVAIIGKQFPVEGISSIWRRRCGCMVDAANLSSLSFIPKLRKCHFSRFLATTYVCIVRLPTIGNLNRLPPPFRSSAQREHCGEGRESAGRRAARVQLRGLRVSAGGRPHLVVRPDRRHGRHGRRARGELRRG